MHFLISNFVKEVSGISFEPRFGASVLVSISAISI